MRSFLAQATRASLGGRRRFSGGHTMRPRLDSIGVCGQGGGVETFSDAITSASDRVASLAFAAVVVEKTVQINQASSVARLQLRVASQLVRDAPQPVINVANIRCQVSPHPCLNHPSRKPAIRAPTEALHLVKRCDGNHMISACRQWVRNPLPAKSTVVRIRGFRQIQLCPFAARFTRSPWRGPARP
jgi:hypothetical protein